MPETYIDVNAAASQPWRTWTDRALSELLATAGHRKIPVEAVREYQRRKLGWLMQQEYWKGKTTDGRHEG